MRYRTGFTLAAFGILAIAAPFPHPLVGQELSDLCPGAGDDEAAIIGLVQDADGGMILPGASVIATWTTDGQEGHVEVLVGLDGTFILCGVPRDTEISLRAEFTQFAGAPVFVSLSGGLGRQDLAVSLVAPEPLAGQVEREEELEEARAAHSKAFSSRDIRRDDLEPLPDMSVFELFRMHSMVRVEPGSDNVYMSGRTVSQRVGAPRTLAAMVYINERRVPFAVEVLKTLWISEVVRIELLSPGEGSARYGGDGLNPIIAIRKR